LDLLHAGTSFRPKDQGGLNNVITVAGVCGAFRLVLVCAPVFS